MKRSLYLFAIIALLTLLQIPASGQFNERGVEIGISGGGALGLNEAEDRPVDPQGRIFLAFPFFDRLQGEFGGGWARTSAEDFSTDMIPLDFRFRLAVLASSKVNFYLYAGAGALNYDVKTVPANADTSYELQDWSAFIPFGGGLEFCLSDRWTLDLSAGDNYTFTDAINPVDEGEDEEADDSYLTFGLGIRYALGGDTDKDDDGLTNSLEKSLGSDPKNPDTDGDGLNDGAEYNQYKTDPTKADTDGDGFKDGDEVTKYKTDPLKADTDGDGLKDGEEISKSKTDPLKADSDGDGLNDGSEVSKSKTDPLKADSDADGLNDGAEINTNKTDPLKADTDGGSVSDGVEVGRGSNPLAAADDVPKPVLKVEKGQKIVLEGITFKTASSEILPASEEILEKALNTFQATPELEVEIHGYTDSRGSRAYNMKLSQSRADAVKAWLVSKGVDAKRITAKGFGPDNPVASNDTDAGRQQNRRIEFVRVK